MIVMVKITKLSPLEIYKLLPRRSGCRLCGEDSCMAFAIKLLSLQTNLEKCKPLIEDPGFRENYEKLSKLLKPLVKEIEIGVGDRKVVIGGKHVVHRHELMLRNPTAIAIDVSDDLDKDKIIEKVEFINNFKYEYVGYELKLDLIAVRSVTNDPERFKSTLKIVNEYSKRPIIICSIDPEIIHAGLEVLDKERPLIYTATMKNWIKVLELVRRFKVPVTISSLGKINDLISLVKTFRKYGISDLCLDPGTI
ncbi:MAG: acetyl-CoA synthase subunit gamma, partial [Thermoprotei archaeon ex4572_64]